MVTLSASNASGSGTLVLTITVNPTALDLWRLANPGTSSNTAAAADSADPDKDGLTNLVEFAFGLNPNLPSAGQLPVWQQTGPNRVLTFTPPAGVSGISYIAEQNHALSESTWTAIPNTGSSPQHTYTVPFTTGPARTFLRVRVPSP